MKKYFISAFIMIALSLGFSQVNAQVRFYVNVRPTAPVVVERPVRPSGAHIWVQDEWTYRGGTYVRVAGHWERPPHGHHTWVAGHWAHEPGHGHYWVAGRWR